MLRVSNLSVDVGGKQVLANIELELNQGEIVSLSGANGGGKSSLAQVLIGNSEYEVTIGEVVFEGNDLLKMTVDERARAGIFLAYQSPIAIAGVKVFTLCKTSYESLGNKIESVVEFKKQLEKLALRVGLSKEHITRSVNEGFSGGERKRLELLQLLLLKPKLAILDEVDSGLDEEGRKLVAEIIKELSGEGVAFLVISHYKELLSEIKISKQWVMNDGRLQTGE